MAKLLEGKLIAEKIKEEFKLKAAELKAKGITPKLVAVQVGENQASAVYLKSQQRVCVNTGVDYQLLTLPESISQADLAAEMNRLNSDSSVSGIIVQMPMPAQLDGRA